MEEANVECSFRQQEAFQSANTCTSIEQVESTSYNLNIPFHEESFQLQVAFSKQETTPIATSIEQVHATTSYSLNVPFHEENLPAISSEDETIQMANHCASTQTCISLINSTSENIENNLQGTSSQQGNCTITEQIDTQTSNSTVGSTEEVSASKEAILQRYSTEEEIIQMTNNITNTKHISSSLNSSTSDNQNVPFQGAILQVPSRDKDTIIIAKQVKSSTNNLNVPFQGASSQVHSSKQDTIQIAKQVKSSTKNINVSSFHVENLQVPSREQDTIQVAKSIEQANLTPKILNVPFHEANLQGTSNQQENIQICPDQVNSTSDNLNESSLPTKVNCNTGSINPQPSSSFDFIELAQHKTEIKAAIISLKTNLVLGVVVVLLFLGGLTARSSNTILGALLKGIIPIATAISNFVIVRDILKMFWNKYVPLCFLK